MITSHVPDDWRDLQNEVARVLNECGFIVEVEKTVSTVRGDVEIDVCAEEQIDGRKYSIVCECKHWKTRVPQNVVHGFRTVVADIGTNVGYTISTAGFQEGAYEATDKTNVSLVSWTEFQDTFEKSWYETFFYPQITERFDALFSYTEPFVPNWFDALSVHQQDDLIMTPYEKLNSLPDALAGSAQPVHRDFAVGGGVLCPTESGVAAEFAGPAHVFPAVPLCAGRERPFEAVRVTRLVSANAVPGCSGDPVGHGENGPGAFSRREVEWRRRVVFHVDAVKPYDRHGVALCDLRRLGRLEHKNVVARTVVGVGDVRRRET